MKALHTVQIKTTILVFWTIVFAFKKGVNFMSLFIEMFPNPAHFTGSYKIFQSNSNDFLNLK